MGKGVRHLPTTERGEFLFVVKVGVTPDVFFIAAEPSGKVLESLDDLIFFDLRPGTTQETAYEIASYLNQHIAMIGLLRFAPGD
jgi:hypothetical protein